jgi:hypothetical protein
MGIVTVRHGLDGQKETYSFNGKIGKHISNLAWERCLIMQNGDVLDHNYRVKPADVLLIQEFPGSGNDPVSYVFKLFVNTISYVVGLVYDALVGDAYRQAEEAMKAAQRAQENALKGQASVSGARKIAGAENAQAEGNVLPFVLGRHLFAPYYVCSPYITVSSADDGSDQYWHGVFIIGQNNLAVSKLKLGTNILRDATIPPGSVVPFDSNSIYYDSENIIEVADGADFSTAIFNQKWATSKEGQAQLEWKYDQAAATAVTREACPQCYAVEVEIGLPALYGINIETGDDQTATVSVYVGWSNDDGKTWNKMNIEGWTKGGSYDSLTRNKNKEMRFIATKTFAAAESYKKQILIKAVRQNQDTKNVNGQKNVYLYAVRSQMYSKTSTSGGLTPAGNVDGSILGKVTRIGVKIKAGENTNGKLDKFNLIACMKGRTYAKGAWAGNGEITNAADVALEVLTGAFHTPSRIADDEIDLPSFGVWHDYCENQTVIVDGAAKTAKLTCNNVLTTSVKKADILAYAARASDAGVYINEFGKYIAYFETPGGIPVAMVNPQNIVRLTYSKSFEVIPDGFKFEYIDAEDGYQVQTKRILRNGVPSAPGMNTYQSVKLDCVTNYLQACWLMRRTLAKQALRPTVYKLSVGMEGRYYRPGDVLLVQDETLKLGIGSGEVKKVYRDNSYVYGIETLESFDFEAGRNYTIQWQAARPNGNRIYSAVVAGNGQYSNRMMFSVPIAVTDSNAAYMPDLEDIVSVTYNGATKFVCGDVYARTDDGYELDIFEHNEAIYQTGPIPARVSSLVGAIGGVDPVSVPQQAITAFEVSELAREAASTAAGKVNPGKYLGVVTAAPASKDNPQITVSKGPETGSVTVNTNDYFLFATAGITGWTNGYLYQWSGTGWAKLATETNTTKYLAAINDITENAPPGIFSDVFCQVLFAQQAAIDTLESQLIQIKNAIFGGERFTRSGDSVVDNGADKTGVMIGADGRLLASDVNVSGIVNADSGMFKDVIIMGNSLFQGNIMSGPMELSNDTPAGNLYTHNKGTNATTIYNLVKSVIGFSDNFEIRTYPVVGTYGTKKIIQLVIQYDITTVYAPTTHYFRWKWYASICYENGTVQQIAYRYEDRYDSGGTNTSEILSYQFTTNAKTFKLLNLPPVVGQENSGVVYAGSDKILRIS